MKPVKFIERMTNVLTKRRPYCQLTAEIKFYSRQNILCQRYIFIILSYPVNGLQIMNRNFCKIQLRRLGVAIVQKKNSYFMLIFHPS